VEALVGAIRAEGVMSDAGTAAPRITVYLTPTCPHCRTACEFLASRGVAFQRVDVTASRDALTQLIWVTGQTMVPAVVVGDEVLIGFDETRLRELIEPAVTETPAPEASD
jgi:glutaredoxin 3